MWNGVGFLGISEKTQVFFGASPAFLINEEHRGERFPFLRNISGFGG